MTGLIIIRQTHSLVLIKHRVPKSRHFTDPVLYTRSKVGCINIYAIGQCNPKFAIYILFVKTFFFPPRFFRVFMNFRI